MKPYWKPRFIVVDIGVSTCANPSIKDIDLSAMATFYLVDGETTHILSHLVELKLGLDKKECHAVLREERDAMDMVFFKRRLVARECLREQYSMEELPVVLRNVGNKKFEIRCPWRL